MTARAREDEKGRVPLSRERVLRAAIEHADAHGLDSLTMRGLAKRLDVEAMSLYHHVANKREILEGITELVARDMPPPNPGGDWKAELRGMAIRAHRVMLRHPWVAGLLLSSSVESETRIRYSEAILATLRQAGFSPKLTDHAYHALESHVMGFTLWLVNMDLGDEAQVAALARDYLVAFPRDTYPYLAEHIELHLEPHDADADFAFGLDLVLDGLERMLASPHGDVG